MTTKGKQAKYSQLKPLWDSENETATHQVLLAKWSLKTEQSGLTKTVPCISFEKSEIQ